MLKSDRRHEQRDEESDRRSFPRPPLWLNLLLLLIAIGGLGLAHLHRKSVEKRYSSVLTERARTPAEVNRMKNELAEMDLGREQLARELDGRLKFVKELKSENFYLSIDTTQKKLRFNYGDTTLREAPVTIGPSGTFSSIDGKRQWTFVPVKGAFPVKSKVYDYTWPVPEWLYAMKREPVPSQRPVIPDGQGKYVLQLPNNYVIHTPPPDDSPLKGPRPGSIMVSEQDLRAIWPRIRSGKTQVYIF